MNKRKFCFGLIAIVFGLIVTAYIPGLSQVVEAARTEPLIIDHNNTNIFIIPDEGIEMAKTVYSVSRHSSDGGWVGKLGVSGLTDLATIDPVKYDRNSFIFDGRGNPGWKAKMDDFGLDDITSTDPGGYAAHNPQYEIYYSWMGASDVLSTTFGPIDFEYYRDRMEEVEALYPEKTFVWTTLGLRKAQSTPAFFQALKEFNDSVRSYVQANNKVLLDLADIQSHDPAGNQYLTTDGYEYLYPSYTTDGLHLDTPLGRQQQAKAYWWLMARLGGWDGTTIEVTPVAPEAPTNLHVTNLDQDSITLSWNDNSTNEDTFNIFQSTNGTDFTSVTEVATNGTVSEILNLEPNTTYWYYVIAENTIGTSTPSNIISTTTPSVIEDPLVINYKFESGILETTLFDSVNSVNGALMGTFAYSSDKVDGENSFVFDGSTTYSTVLHHEVLDSVNDEMTISIWAKISRTGANDYVISKPGSFSIDLERSSEDLPHATLSINGTTYNLESDEAFPRDEWSQIALTYSNVLGNISLYVNGELVDTEVASGLIDFTEDDMFVGRDEVSDVFQGNLDDIRIYDKAMNAEEISALYHEYVEEETTLPTDGLVTYYSFDEGSGTIVTDTVNGNNGSLVNGTLWAAGKVGNGSLSFDGVNDKVTITSLSGDLAGSGSISAWVKLDRTNCGTQNHVMTDDNAARNGFRFANADCDFVFRNDAGSDILVDFSDSGINPAEWHHYVGIAGSTGMQLYIDGVLRGTNTNSTGLILTGTYTIGTNLNTASPFLGQVDEVYLYDRMLTEAEVGLIYTNGL